MKIKTVQTVRPGADSYECNTSEQTFTASDEIFEKAAVAKKLAKAETPETTEGSKEKIE